MNRISRLPRRGRAAGLHLMLSAAVPASAALLVFLLWYPPPYAAIAGGLGLFALLVSVDVVPGPALPAVAASQGKPLSELRRDLAVIVTIQVAGFAYGMYSIALAWPVFLEALRFLPLISRQASWSAVIAPRDARIIGSLPVDGFL